MINQRELWSEHAVFLTHWELYLHLQESCCNTALRAGQNCDTVECVYFFLAFLIWFNVIFTLFCFSITVDELKQCWSGVSVLKVILDMNSHIATNCSPDEDMLPSSVRTQPSVLLSSWNLNCDETKSKPKKLQNTSAAKNFVNF